MKVNIHLQWENELNHQLKKSCQIPQISKIQESNLLFYILSTYHTYPIVFPLHFFFTMYTLIASPFYNNFVMSLFIGEEKGNYPTKTTDPHLIFRVDS